MKYLPFAWPVFVFVILCGFSGGNILVPAAIAIATFGGCVVGKKYGNYGNKSLGDAYALLVAICAFVIGGLMGNWVAAFLVAAAAKAQRNGAKARTPKMDGRRLQAELPTLPTTGGLFAPMHAATEEESTPALVETKPAEGSVPTLTTPEHTTPTAASASADLPGPANLKIVVAIVVVILVLAGVWALSR